MATPTYTLIDSTTLGSSAASVTFSSISATGKGDLVLAIKATGATGNTDIQLRFNGDSGTNYSSVYMAGNGSSATSGTTATNRITVGGQVEYSDGTNAQQAICQIADFSATDKHKSVLSRSNVAAGAGAGTSAFAGRWANTAAITSISVVNNTYGAGSTFFLYQIVSE